MAERENAFISWFEALSHDELELARYLNTISLLEHIGSRKLAKSIPQQQFSYDLLTHLKEECEHALFFKDCAQKIAGKTLGYSADELMAPKSAKRYIQGIDRLAQSMSLELRDKPYTFATWLIEIRAMWVYPKMEQVLKKRDLGISLRKVIHDERRHLREMNQQLKHLPRWNTLKPFWLRREEELFDRFFESLHSVLELEQTF